MLRLLKETVFKSKIHDKVIFRYCSNELSATKSRKIAVITSASAVLVSTVVYSKYNSELRSFLERNAPYIDEIYKLLPDFREYEILTHETAPDNEKKLTDFLNDKLNNGNLSQKLGNDSKITEFDVNKLENELAKQNVPVSKEQFSNLEFNEGLFNDTVKQLESSCIETLSAYNNASEEIRKHMQSLFVALSDNLDSNIVWKQAYQASNNRHAAIKKAEEKASNTKALIEKLKTIAKNVALEDPEHPLINRCNETTVKIEKKLNNSQTKIKSVAKEIKVSSEYQKLVNKYKELQQKFGISPYYTPELNDKNTLSDSDLNALLANAHQKIEKLQKHLAKKQVTEDIRLDEALRQEKLKQNSLIEDKIQAELEKRNIEIERAVARTVSSLKQKFESELKELLYFQAVAHIDHIQEILKAHEQELERKFSLALEERVLSMTGAITSDISRLMVRLKEILSFLEAKTELDVESRKAQSLWLSCQSLSNKIFSNACHLSALEEDIASIKLSAGESNVYVSAVVAGIPNEALTRGVYSPDTLKQMFFKVKKNCRKVAMIDENNDSLYRYLLSYLQSCLIIDEVSIPAAEIEGKIAVDPREWDTYDILSRISYSLKIDNLEQALRYANQLKGEARIVASDWIKELRLLLETQIVVKALSVHAASVNVQAYH